MYAIATGNPFDGMTIYGPFNVVSEAIEWTEPGSNTVTDLKNVEWNCVQLENPYPELKDRDVLNKDVLNKDDDFDEFLDDATHMITDMWNDRGGQLMGINEKYALNDLLTQFFGNKRV